MFNKNLGQNSGIKNNNEIEWNRMSLLCESFFNANCFDNKEGTEAGGSENCCKFQEKSKLSTESRPFNKIFSESNSNVNYEGNSLFEKTEKVRDPTSTDVIELSLKDSDYLSAKNRWYDFSDTELDFASAERMNYINLLTECFSNRNFGEYSSQNRKLSSNLTKPGTKDQIDSRLFSKKQDMPRKYEVSVENDGVSKSGEGDSLENNSKTEKSNLMSNNSASVKKHINFGTKNHWSNYQTHQRGDHFMHCRDDNNCKGNFVTNLFRSEVGEAGTQIAKMSAQRSPPKQKSNNGSECCMRSQTENEEIRKRLENLERIMLTKINSYQFDNGCESPMSIGQKIGLEPIFNNKLINKHIDKSGIFPCRKYGFHNWEKYGNRGNSVERHQNYQKVVVDEGGNKIADNRTNYGRKSRSLKYKEQLLTESNGKNNCVADLRDSQMTSFADSWSEFEMENIFENNRWSKESSRASSSSSSKRSYVTSDYTLIRRRKKYHRGNRRGRKSNSRKNETSEKYCHESDKRRSVPSEKRQSVEPKAFSTARKDKRCDDEEDKAPTYVEELKEHTVVNAAVGRNHTLFLTDRGIVYACGDNKMGQCGSGNGAQEHPTAVRVRYKGPPIVKVVCGADFSIILDCKGMLHSFGSPEYGQLGHNTNGEYIGRANKISYMCEKVPKIIMMYVDKGKDNHITPIEVTDILDVACGTNHTVALDSRKRVFAWGFGGYGRLGHADTKDELVPRLVKFFETQGRGAKGVACGSSFSIVYTENKMSYLFGQTKKTGEANMYPKPIQDLSGWNVRAAACGNTCVVVAADNSVISWGPSPAYGELGHGEIRKSTPNALEVRALEGIYVESVSCGMHHTLMIAKDDSEAEKEKIDMLPEYKL